MSEDIIIRKQIQNYGCLTTCIIMLEEYFFKKNIHSIDAEARIMQEAFKDEYLHEETGYIKYLASKGLSITALVENYDLDKELQLIPKVNSQVRILDKSDFEEQLNKGRIILCAVDDYMLHKDFHGAHFVLIQKQTKDSFEIIDPILGDSIEWNKDEFIENLDKLKEEIHYSANLFAINKR